MWPDQIADALRELIHQANLAREAGHDTIPTSIRDELITRFRHGVLVGLSDTTTTAPTRPGQRLTLLIGVLTDHVGGRLIGAQHVLGAQRGLHRLVEPGPGQAPVSYTHLTLPTTPYV